MQLLKSQADLHILDYSLVLSQRKTSLKSFPEIKDSVVRKLICRNVVLAKPGTVDKMK